MFVSTDVKGHTDVQWLSITPCEQHETCRRLDRMRSKLMALNVQPMLTNNHKKQYERYADKCRVNQVDESPSSYDGNREWWNCISTPNKKYGRCKMLVAGQQVTFLIDKRVSINMLPVKYAKYGTEPSTGVLEMWNEVEDKPI